MNLKRCAKFLEQKGYETAYFGKFHNGRLHFDTLSDEDPNDANVTSRMEKQYATIQEFVSKSTNCGIADRIFQGNPASLNIPKELQHHNVPWVLEGAINTLKDAVKTNAKLYMEIHLTYPHGSFDIKKNSRATPRGYLERAPDILHNFDVANACGENAHNYCKAAATLDEIVKIVYDEISADGVWENTLFLVLSDHSMAAKGTVYDAGSRTLGLISWPAAIPRGAVFPNITANIDVSTSLLAFWP